MSKRAQQVDAFLRQGQHLHMAGRLAEAEHIYRQVIALMPRHADALHALGALALQSGRPAVAETLLNQAITLKPAVEYHVTRAHALLAMGRPDEAARVAEHVVRVRPGDAGAHQTLGHALADAGHPEQAIEQYRTARRLDPDLADLRNNLGMALRQAGRLEDAERELRLAPPKPESLVNLSSVQKELGAFTEAEASLRQALDLSPGTPVLRYNWALLMLLLGRTEEAWDGWEQRFRAGAIPARTSSQPQWQGEPTGSLLIHAEQGLGDVIQFARYLPAPRNAVRIIFEAPARLIRLLSSNPAFPPMIAAGEPTPATDAVVPLLSLPARTSQQPVSPPYLFADPDRTAAWAGRIGQKGFRIGINWQGFPGRFEDKGRSVPLSAFQPLAVPGVRLISLQKTQGVAAEDQIAAAGLPVETLDGLDEGPDALLDTAAVMMTLDLVVTSDTSIAHLAGALGRPVWVALRRVPDWRWMLDRPDSPWYPTMRLFRQVRDGDWSSVFAAMAEALPL